jgi:hypothetical protein
VAAITATPAGAEVTPVEPTVAGVFASSASQSGAILNGTVNPQGAVAGWRFVYVSEADYRPGCAECEEEPADAYALGRSIPVPEGYLEGSFENEAVSQPVTNLQAGTTYHFALIAGGPGGTEISPDETLTTTVVSAPTVSTGAATAVTQTAATLSGVIDPQGWATTYHFEYGTSTAYGQDWPTLDVSAGDLAGEQSFSVYTERLQPSTTYHYRLVATNGGGTSYGADQTFTTLAYPTAVIQEAVVGLPVGIEFLEETATIKPTTRGLTKAEKLKSALKACKKDERKSRRAACEKSARKKYK